MNVQMAAVAGVSEGQESKEIIKRKLTVKGDHLRRKWTVYLERSAFFLAETVSWVSGSRLKCMSGVDKKTLSRIYSLRNLRSINVFTKMLHIFSVAETAIYFAAICWGQQRQSQQFKENSAN